MKLRATLAIVTLFAVPLSASTLLFSTNTGGSFGNGSPIPQTCGDRITATTDSVCSYGIGAEGATPNVTVTYFWQRSPFLAGTLLAWAANYGSLLDVAYYSTGSGILFEADPGYTVTLRSLELAGWPNASRRMSVTVFGPDSTTELFASGPVFAPGVGSLLVTPGVTATALYLEIGGDFFNGGIDNVTFSQNAINPIPEPSTWAMLAGGLAIVAGRLRKR